MKEKETDFSEFGEQFQENLVKLMIKDRPFCDRMEEVIDVSYFTVKFLRTFTNILMDYRKKHKVHPTPGHLATILTIELKEEADPIRKQIGVFFKSFMDAELRVEGSDYIQEKALDFCRSYKLKSTMIDCLPLLKEHRFEDVQKRISAATVLGADQNHGYDYMIDFERRFDIKARNPLSTGWSEIDRITHGGFGSGDLGVVIGATGGGKSHALVSLGSSCLLAGKNVIHYTLELADVVIGKRYDSCITGIPIGQLNNNKDSVYEAVKNLNGKLIIKEYPTKSASTHTLTSHLERLASRGIDPSLIIVDYADLLKPIGGFGEKRHDLEGIYEELRGIGSKFGCPLVTASQSNRKGANAEIITTEEIAEAYSKCFVADFIWSISRTTEDKNSNAGRFFVAKNRNGPDGLVFPIHIDCSTSRIHVHGEEPLEAVLKSSAENQVKREADADQYFRDSLRKKQLQS